MATKTKKPKTDPNLAYSQGVVNLKYDPQLTGIRDLFTQAKQQYADDRSNARENARDTISYVKQAAPQVKSTFETAKTGIANAQADVAPVLAKVGGTAGDLFRAATTREQSAAKTAIATAQADAEHELTDRQLGAAAGRALALDQAARSYARTKDTLSTHLQDIARNMGTDLGVTLQDVTNTQAKTQSQADTQAAKDAAAAKKAQDAKDKAAQAHVEKVHTATGDFTKKVADIQAHWRQLTTERSIPVTKYDPTNDQADKNGYVPVTDKNGQPTFRTAKPDEIKRTLAKAPYNYTPDEVHIALLAGNKPLDSQAIAYLKTLTAQGVRIPRAWLRNQMEQRIASNQAAGPQTPGR